MLRYRWSKYIPEKFPLSVSGYALLFVIGFRILRNTTSGSHIFLEIFGNIQSEHVKNPSTGYFPPFDRLPVNAGQAHPAGLVGSFFFPPSFVGAGLFQGHFFLPVHTPASTMTGSNFFRDWYNCTPWSNSTVTWRPLVPLQFWCNLVKKQPLQSFHPTPEKAVHRE